MVDHFPGSWTIGLPSALAESGTYSPDRTYHCTLARAASSYLAFHDDSGTCLVCATSLPEGHTIGAREEAHWMNTIINQSNRRRRVSTDRLNHFNSQLVEGLEVGSSSISTGKTLPHSYPKTRILRERERTHNVVCGSIRYIIVLTLWGTSLFYNRL